ncbi:DNA-binding protein [Halorubrum sp. 48-1-W]|uniref:helix-turn-helix domain-containing protein n=1 Tax=Halorubrum sp. 48-1-W TaxID=2249761 RepID=UPI000DCE3B22|nr:helix-turn-helix domain-containing protein [Halorubrum sp. 48-1-W]RAW44610.1 DNA-binding protein [Halorubrum sp. 48-1-W]
METVVDATVPLDRFVLEETIERVPDVELEFVQSAVHSSARPMPFLWASTSRPDRLEAALRDDPSTERVNHLSRDDGRDLYSIDWTARAAGLIDGFAEADGSVLDVRGTADCWLFRILFADRAMASETFQTWCDAGTDVSLSRVGSLSCRERDTGGLSETQHTTIAQAFRTDYYDVPRGTTLEELAAEFGVSHQAVSERLRRGHSHLVERMLSESTVGSEGRP